ncbi:DENN domain-containing protein 2A [Nilaparvata lugens]|uniref:DENN domain-containing protein 2A n=1 Tax=Nilaparvata lugens TaxID=108931 RepID=UPI00193D48F5|nr:DENN domain-containing protein 2A [Nilaparvata lugens]
MERNRVEDIKKKFEGLNQTPIRNVNVLGQRHNSVSKQFVEGNQFEKLSSNTNKGNIKRSHAFRSEKLSRPPTFESKVFSPKTVFPTPKKELVRSLPSSSSKTLDSKEPDRLGFLDPTKENVGLDSKTLPNKSPECSYSVVLKNNKSPSDTVKNKVDASPPKATYSPVFKPSSIRNKQPGNRPSIELKKENLDTFLGIADKNSRNQTEQKKSPIKRNIVKNNIERIELEDENNRINNNVTPKVNNSTNSQLQSLLNAPLPPGPPPKKPPRTFAHDLRKNFDSKNAIDLANSHSKHNPEVKPVRSKTESQIMLKKLENYLLAQEKKVVENSREQNETPLKPPRDHLRSQKLQDCRKTPNLNRCLPSTPDNNKCAKPSDTHNDLKFCFNILNCTKPPVYDGLVTKRSNFFISPPSSASKLIEVRAKPYGQLNRRSASEEHVYAEPLQNENRSADCSKDECARLARRHESLPESSTLEEANKRSEYGLHYMSTPIDSSLLDSSASKAEIKFLASNERLNEAVNFRLNLLNNFSTGNKLPLSTFGMSAKNANSTPAECEGIDKKSIQFILNEVYNNHRGKQAAGDGSDSDSVVSTPEDPTAPQTTGNSKQKNDMLSHKDREQLTAERKGYVRRVSSRMTSVHRSHNQSPDQFPHLFECLLLVGLDLDPARCKVPYIKSRYPENAIAPRIEELCFPDAQDWPPSAGSGQSYAQVLTDADGRRRYGYCRRVQPEGAAVCLPLAYCVVTPFKANSLYNKVLMELESKHGLSETKMNQFIDQLYQSPFPAPGHSLYINDGSNGERIEIFPRPLDIRQEDNDLSELLGKIKISVFLQIFATLLHERKVILLSESISKLSVCIEGLQSALFPFHWQHTLVPILPSVLMDVCHAPTPYLIGIIKPKLMDLPLNNIDLDLVVDVDDGTIVHSVGDEAIILPSRLSRALRSALNLSLAASKETCNLLASEALIRLFVELLGHYREYITVSPLHKKREFQRDLFVKSISSRSIQLFLEWFTETAMFNAFIQSRLERTPESRGLFEQRCSEYAEENDHGRLVKNYKALNKTVKNLGDRFKDWATLS